MDERPTTTVTSLIRVELARRNWSRQDLADKLGVSAMWVSRRLNDDVPITVDDMQRIAAVLGVDAAVLLNKAAS